MFPVRVYIELLPAWPKSAGDSGRSGTSMRKAIRPEPLLYLTYIALCGLDGPGGARGGLGLGGAVDGGCDDDADMSSEARIDPTAKAGSLPRCSYVWTDGGLW